MGCLNLSEKDHFLAIKRRLSVRGLKPILDADAKGNTDWEVHGPHSDMNYQVCVGPVYETVKDNLFYVAIYPRKVYAISDFSEWWNTDTDNTINVCKAGVNHS
jgi:hypothetical protein